jgi:hypothetical protein
MPHISPTESFCELVARIVSPGPGGHQVPKRWDGRPVREYLARCTRWGDILPGIESEWVSDYTGQSVGTYSDAACALLEALD